jgi:hypothetical protein
VVVSLEEVDHSGGGGENFGTVGLQGVRKECHWESRWWGEVEPRVCVLAVDAVIVHWCCRMENGDGTSGHPGRRELDCHGKR